MIVWIDAQLSPLLAEWMNAQLGVEAYALRDLELRDASDQKIFESARESDAIVLTKDSDFVRLLELHGAPPRVLWLTIGNTSTARVQEVLLQSWPRIVDLFDGGEALVEVQARGE